MSRPAYYSKIFTLIALELWQAIMSTVLESAMKGGEPLGSVKLMLAPWLYLVAVTL